MTDDILQRIERFRFSRGVVVAESRNRGKKEVAMTT